MIKIWQSYSCNNSSSYRLVARFADAGTARETAAELAEFFEAQARLEEQRRTYRYQDASLTVLARTYGFDWQDGGAGDNGDGPHVFTEDDVLIVFHAYCLGLGPGVPAFLLDRGARVDKERAGHLQMSLLFRAVPGVDPGLDQELATVFSQLDGKDRRNVHPFQAPWSSTIRSSGRLTCFRDAGTVGLYFPANPEDIVPVKAWLARHGIENALMHFEEPADAFLFEALAAARCTACNGLLEYLDPRLCDIETPQLVCKPCGGLYDLSAFVQATPMTIKIWQAFSCNNSGSYRLIARFVDAPSASAAKAELAKFLEAHVAEHGKRTHGETSPLQVLARRYGFEEWEDDGWGGPEDGPHVIVDDAHLIVYHAYCLGFGPGIPALLTAQGGTVEKETWADVQVSMLFRAAPGVDPALDEDLDALFAQPIDTSDYKGPTFKAPWSTIESRGRAVWFRDAGTVGLFVPINPLAIAELRAWLAKHEIEVSLRLDEPADEKLFTALAGAKCTACNGSLEYLDPRLHDIETPQLVCKPCGGLYELAAFFTP